MFLDALTSSYAKISEFSFIKRDDDGLVDKLFRKLSMILMATFAVVITTFKLVGNPIDCWCLSEYSDAKCEYAKTYCYITNFYVPVSNDSSLPRKEELLSHKIQYYQWVPYIFLLQAFLFYFPCMIWRAVSTISGFDIRTYVKVLEGDNADMASKFVAQHIDSSVSFRHNYQPRGAVKRVFRSGGSTGTSMRLTLGYLFVKCVYVFIALAQIVLLNYWLRDTKESVTLGSLLFGKQNWNLKERFPRMTLCNFQVYILTSDQTHWVQCTLPINIYIEKIYIFLWFWLWFLIVLGLLSIMKYIVVIFGRIDGSIVNALYYEAGSDEEAEKLSVVTTAEAIKKRLAFDGLLVLRLLRANTDKIKYNKVIKDFGDLMLAKNS